MLRIDPNSAKPLRSGGSRAYSRPLNGSANQPRAAARRPKKETDVTKIVLTHAVEDVERWLGFKSERAASIGAMGASNVVDHVAADGSKNVAVSFDAADAGAIQAGLASPPPELVAAMQRHGVVQPVVAHVEK
jgi:hypothetical protein